MVDPGSIALGAAIGGATGKFVEKAWDSGERWLAKYFEGHGAEAKANAENNAQQFLRELAARVDAIEQTHAEHSDSIARAQEHPQFSATLHRAMISASLTESRDKHALLAQLVSERLTAEPESLLSLATAMATDAVGSLTRGQLRLLGLAASIGYVQSPYSDVPQSVAFFQARISQFINVTPTDYDYLNLEAASCAQRSNFGGRNLTRLLNRGCHATVIDDAWESMPIWGRLLHIWNEKELKFLYLTTVGILIGTTVYDNETGHTTDKAVWRTLR